MDQNEVTVEERLDNLGFRLENIANETPEFYKPRTAEWVGWWLFISSVITLVGLLTLGMAVNSNGNDITALTTTQKIYVNDLRHATTSIGELRARNSHLERQAFKPQPKQTKYELRQVNGVVELWIDGKCVSKMVVK